MSVTKQKDSLHEKVIECREHGYLLSAKKIGTGAFSKVYLGYATSNKIFQNYKLANDLRSKNHNMVAIKIISINDAPPEYSKKFLPREIFALNATYRHPSVVQLYDVFCSVRHAYLVLELAMQGDLLEHINAVSLTKSSPGLPEDQTRHIFRQIVSAVSHCHSNRIAHRDLKCENILLDERGFVKLTDFGFANHYSDRNALMSTFCGSVAYTAPEILLSRKYSGEQADVWSLGVILYAMITGKLPYHEKHPRKLVRLIRKGLPFHRRVSAACQDLMRKLLQWQPSARLPLGQISKHHWMAPSSAGLPYKVNATKSDITDKTAAHSKRTGPAMCACRLYPGAWALQAPPPQSGPGTCAPKTLPTRLSQGMCTLKTPPTRLCPGTCAPKTPPTRLCPGTCAPQSPLTWRCHISLPEGPKSACASWCLGSFVTCCRRSGAAERRVSTACPCTAHPSPCHLLTRPSPTRLGGPHQLFISCPRPPSALKPFHNHPNFQKPGTSPSPDPHVHGQVCTLSGRLPCASCLRMAIAGLDWP